jgi:D-glycerate 3-kinase
MSEVIVDLLADIVEDVRRRRRGRPALIGLGGSQGSGKSYQCRALAARENSAVAHFSLDDVYLTHAEREHLGRTRHPLFRTRGAPGTHDLGLADRTLDRLRRAQPNQETPIPRFDKLKDDRAPPSEWTHFKGRPCAIIVEGWCMGAVAPKRTPKGPINALEAEEDPKGRWRKMSFAYLRGRYKRFHQRFDEHVYLRAPSWEIVRRWRGQQQEELLGRAMTEAEGVALDNFVAHYERLTRAMIDGSNCARWIVHLDDARNVLHVEQRDLLRTSP